MEARQEVYTIKCRYCLNRFEPEPQIRKEGGKLMTYVECPFCGNGEERTFRKYDRRKK